ncbi:cysteine hydrolase [Pistricoccus aurantiacus]|uniref:Cysteine hydrolase n=1 Tax=Pistricoccus aurantiacus TaxID=1883414 RepID=A0A5B8SX27_9GAMM|nr:cysteine hydrolase family protein [Pistricoccus aurantiacus]QEA40664.1 cysteine hydrolase [Pistricoccus aurantiacus]
MNQTDTTLRDLLGLGHQPASLKDSALLLIDCQNTYREGVMRLTGVEEALKEARKLLDRARELDVPIIHIRHDAGAGSPFDINADIGAIADIVAPRGNEPVVTKNYPNSFVETDLDKQLKALGVTNLVLAGFMTHMCVNSTAHGGFNLGYAPTVVASATASRPLETPDGKRLSAKEVHDAALASTRDLYAAVVERVEDLP